MSEADREITPTQKMWRHGRLLICHRDAPFPDRCVKSNDPIGRERKKIKLKWRHPLLGLVPGHSRLRDSQTAKVVLAVGLCSGCRARLRFVSRIAALWLGASLVAVLLGFAGVTPYSAELMFGGFFGLFLGFLLDRLFGRVLTAKEIDNRYVRARGASAAFLAEFPEWPGGTKG